MKHSIVEIVKGRVAKYTHFQNGKLYYEVQLEDGKYNFPVDVMDRDEVGSAVFLPEDKASLFIRYIRKAIKSEELRFTPNMAR